jgi:hypothetical protein
MQPVLGVKLREFGLSAVKVFRDANVEKEAIDFVGSGAKTRDLGHEEVSLDG